MHALPFVRHCALALTLMLAALVGACDSSEDPRLLNPPLPDSTLLRVVNLTEGDPIYVSVNATPVAADIGGLQTSPYRPVLFLERVNIMVTRGGRTDTLRDQALTAGVRATIFVATRNGQSTILLRQAGKVEQADVVALGVARATFINAIPDSLAVTVRTGCQSGEPLFRDVVFGATTLYETKPTDLSLYLFSGAETTARTSGHLPLEAGTILWLVAARSGGADRFFAIGPNDAGLREIPQEERSEASVEVLNALAAGASISASLAGEQIATDLEPLELSSARMVQACRSATGDSLLVTTGGGDVQVPLRMDVGSRTLAIVYGAPELARALALRLDPPPGVPDRAYVRLVNVSTRASGAQLQIGAGAPDSLAMATTFPALTTGQVSGYAAVTPGAYPLLLQESGTGRHLHGGIEELAAGYHTVIVVDRGASAELLVLDHDANGTVLGDIDQPGSRVRLFSLLSDGDADFSIGPLRVEGLAYSYTASTIVPHTVTTVSSTAGDASVDHSTGSLVIGVTGSSASRRIFSFASPAGSPPAGRAAIRILNAVPDVAELSVEFDETKSARFGEPTETYERNEGRYSFTIRLPGSETVVARITGVELRGGRRYLLVIGPRRPSDASDEPYRALLIQE